MAGVEIMYKVRFHMEINVIVGMLCMFEEGFGGSRNLLMKINKLFPTLKVMLSCLLHIVEREGLKFFKDFPISTLNCNLSRVFFVLFQHSTRVFVLNFSFYEYT